MEECTDTTPFLIEGQHQKSQEAQIRTTREISKTLNYFDFYNRRTKIFVAFATFVVGFTAALATHQRSHHIAFISGSLDLAYSVTITFHSCLNRLGLRDSKYKES
jgi:hypothetical protein